MSKFVAIAVRTALSLGAGRRDIAAGAAIGVLAVGTAVAWTPPPPQPGLCRCYTDSTERNGFWDTCP